MKKRTSAKKSSFFKHFLLEIFKKLSYFVSFFKPYTIYMKLKGTMIAVAASMLWLNSSAQSKLEMVDMIIKEVNENSQVERLGLELIDDIGPRLMGTPGMKKANDWVVKTYKSWGVQAINEKYGQWKGWERGTTEVVMQHPRLQQLSAIQLAWCPATKGAKPVEATLIRMPIFKDSAAYVAWLPQVKGKIVLISKMEVSGRPEATWKENGLQVDYDALVIKNREQLRTWNDGLSVIGLAASTLPGAMEKAGAVAVISSYWSGGWGTNRIFGARTEKIPNVDVSMEDYSMLCRFLDRGIIPTLTVKTTSKDWGIQEAFNSVGTIQGVDKPDEYVMLSAHLDSWDGATGATDNGTGTITMMEVMRVLKKVYPNPKRTIIAGHWGGEEQGLNGSRAYAADHLDQLERISVLFNQDNGTGRINWINGNGFLNAYDYFKRWLSYVPMVNRNEIKTDFPGHPGGRGASDYAAFLAHGVPAFFLIGNSWDYGTYTWHTHLDTYDKIVFEDVKKNVETIAILVYMACEEPELFSRQRAKLPINVKTGKQDEWPTPVQPNREGKY